MMLMLVLLRGHWDHTLRTNDLGNFPSSQFTDGEIETWRGEELAQGDLESKQRSWG